MRTVTNYLRNAKHIVFNEQNCVRYCDADYHQLWGKIDFNQYKKKGGNSYIEQIVHELLELPVKL